LPPPSATGVLAFISKYDALANAGYPRGWEFVRDAQKYYRPVFELVTWSMAHQRCRQFGSRSRLVDINSEREGDAVKDFVDSFDRKSSNSKYKSEQQRPRSSSFNFVYNITFIVLRLFLCLSISFQTCFMFISELFKLTYCTYIDFVCPELQPNRQE